MKSAMVRCLVVALAGLGSTETVAQRGRAHRAPPRERTEGPPLFAFPRVPATTSRPADDGIIHWNTPNKDGNLGGPGTGGSGGGGG
jgi:hypothetical protein